MIAFEGLLLLVTLNHITVCKLFLLRIVSWSYNSFLRVLLKLLVNWNDITVCKQTSILSAGALEYTDCTSVEG